MALEQRSTRESTRTVVARFLADHQDCKGSIGVHRATGAGGRLVISCGGCGKSISCQAADLGELTNLPPERPGETRSAPPDRRLPKATLAVLAALGIALIAIAILRAGRDSEPTAQESPTGVETTVSAPAAPAGSAKPAEPAKPAPKPSLRRRDFQDLYTLGVPAGWSASSEGLVVTLNPPSDSAELRVFYQEGERSPAELANAAARFLLDQHPGAGLSAPKPERIGGVRGARVVARWHGGRETASLVADDGFTFLVLARVDGRASELVAASADASAASLRAKVRVSA